MPAAPEPNIDTTPFDAPSVTREITIDAPVEDVWEAVSTDEGRERWLEQDPERELVVEESVAPEHITWWWWRDDEPARRVDVDIAAVPAGTRVTVTETEPMIFPLAQLASTAAQLASTTAQLASMAAHPAAELVLV
jgi:uncharacterized protein YndB with AHSA1/START domain